MSYLSRLLSRNTYNTTIHGPSKYLFSNCNLLNAPKKPILCPTQISLQQIPLLQCSPFTTIRMKTIKQDELIEPGIMEHDKYNACLGRPLSPHIRIYQKQLTALLSFGHRLTGLMMVFYVYVITAGTWIWPDITTFFDYLETLDVYIGEYWWTAAHRTWKLLVAYPFCYHSMNAIRHLSWDFGRLLGMSQIYTSGYLMQIMVLATSLFLALLVPFPSDEEEEEVEAVPGEIGEDGKPIAAEEQAVEEEKPDKCATPR